jgi:hypothetical protein
MVMRNDTGEVRSTFTPGANVANTSIVFECAVESVTWVRCRVTTGPSTNGMTIVIAAGGLIVAPFVTAIDRKDTARTSISLVLPNTTAGTTAVERIETMNISRGTTAVATNTSFAITNGKKFRITGIRFSHTGHLTATTASVVWRIRMNTAGAAIVTSNPVIFNIGTRSPATSLAQAVFDVQLGEGYEIDNTAGGIQIGFTTTPTFTTNAPTYDVAVIGYEY